jgi:transposase InsO family protein
MITSTVKQKDFFLIPQIKLLEPNERWRRVAKILEISSQGRQRLEWIIYSREGHDITETCRHFGISRKSFYKWSAFFDEDNMYSLYGLEDRSKAPLHVRQQEITPIQESRIVSLRKRWMYWGKMKLVKKYKEIYGEEISTWHIQCVITKYKLYRNRKKVERTSKKRAKSRSIGTKKRTVELTSNLPDYKKTSGYIICLDTIVFYWFGIKRYVFTAVDKYGKVAFARGYKSKSSRNGADFLNRLYYLLDGEIPRVGHDNGTEFGKEFKQLCQKLKIEQYYSRVRTPKDNPECERFNQTLKREFINEGKFNPNPDILNRDLTEWLIEYNFQRPHEALNYQTPLQYCKVLPMYSSCTRIQQVSATPRLKTSRGVQ